AVGASYAVSIVIRSPRSLASRRWWTRTRLGAGVVSDIGGSLRLTPAARHREPTVPAEGQGRDLRTGRVLPALPLGSVHQGQDLVDDLGVEATRQELLTSLGVLDVGVQH